METAPYGHNDFGFSHSNYAGGKLGELGGRFYSCKPDEEPFKAYYGDVTGRLTLEDRLTARGRFVAREFCTDSSFALGWFNSRKQGHPLENFVGVYFDSLSDRGRIAMPLYGTIKGTQRAGGDYLVFKPGTQYEWTLLYDPAAADGRGTITFTLAGNSVTHRLQEGDKTTGALLDRFRGVQPAVGQQQMVRGLFGQPELHGQQPRLKPSKFVFSPRRARRTRRARRPRRSEGGRPVWREGCF